MNKTKITIIGGASIYTPGIFASLVKNIKDLNLKEVCLHDVHEENLEKMHEFLKIYSEHYNLSITVTRTKNLVDAIKDSTFIFVQIREGGLEMRIHDEEIAVKYGSVGQETCGAGGFAFGLRQISSLIEIVKTANKYSPNAWILNYSNPISIVSEAVKKEVDSSKVLWICDQPVGDSEAYANIIKRDYKDFIWDHFGLNHFFWFTSVKDKKSNKEHIEIIRKKFLNKSIEKKDGGWEEIRDKNKWYISRMNEFLPTSYMQYYFFPKKSVEIIKKKGHTRAYYVINGRRKDVFSLIEKTIKTKKIDNEYEIGIHGQFIVDQAIAIFKNEKTKVSVNIENNGYIENLPSDWIIEAPGILDAKGPRFAKKSIGKIPEFYRNLIIQQKTYELLSYDAWKNKSYDLALQALVTNKIVNNLETAKNILDEYIEINKDYWPKLKQGGICD